MCHLEVGEHGGVGEGGVVGAPLLHQPPHRLVRQRQLRDAVRDVACRRRLLPHHTIGCNDGSRDDSINTNKTKLHTNLSKTKISTVELYQKIREVASDAAVDPIADPLMKG